MAPGIFFLSPIVTLRYEARRRLPLAASDVRAPLCDPRVTNARDGRRRVNCSGGEVSRNKILIPFRYECTRRADHNYATRSFSHIEKTLATKLSVSHV